MNRGHSLARIFAVPVMIGFASAVGLIAALFGDGLWDAAGWVGLGAPIVVAAWCLRSDGGRRQGRAG